MFSCDHKKTCNQNANQAPESNSDIMDWEFLNIKFTEQTKGSDFKKKIKRHPRTDTLYKKIQRENKNKFYR